MLFTPGNGFGFSVDNWGANSHSAANFGTAVTAHATNANTKGTAVSLIAGSSVTEDIFGIAIGFGTGAASAAVRNFLADILIDPAGGSSWTTLIPNLATNSPAIGGFGFWFYFPLWIKSGTSIGCQVQCTTANIVTRVGVRLYGKPSRPEMCRVGTRVKTFGAVTASSEGTAVTPGNGNVGSYSASLGTTADDIFWWQLGFGCNDSTKSSVGYMFDIACGDASNKLLVAEGIPALNDASENTQKAAFGYNLPMRDVPAGANVYVRASASSTPDSNITATVHGVAA